VARSPALLALSALLAGCVGPPAPDAALCRDVITRLCLGPVCPTTQSSLSLPADGCEATLLERTGCGSDEFAFTRPDRARVLECRRPLVRVSSSTFVKAPCPDVDAFFATCPDLTTFLSGSRP
jgi:hypothetical protein